MGLDMYLSEETYLSHWPHSEGTSDYKKAEKVLEALQPVTPTYTGGCGITVSHPVMVWRKANQIHRWFVENVQEGVDNCGSYEVSTDQLETLRDLCKVAVDTRDASLLPPQSGFFFGGTDVDKWYWSDLVETRDALTIIVDAAHKAVEDEVITYLPWYNYQSSW